MQQAIRDAFSIKKNFKSIFQRSTNNLAALDGLRALSILWVLIFHVYFLTVLVFSTEDARYLLEATPWFFNWVWNGDKGVDTFFVMSGFLIAGLLFREHDKSSSVNLKRFYWRRFLRLTPVYWLALVLYLLVGGSHGENIWANFIYLNNFLPGNEMPMTWSWSLAVEEQFYLLFPLFLLLVLLKSRHKTRWLLGLLLLSLVVRFWLFVSDPLLTQYNLTDIFNLERSAAFDHYFDVLYINLYTRFGPFICGILASYWFFYHRKKLEGFFQKPAAGWVIVLGLFLTVGFALAPSYHQNIEYSRWYEMFFITGFRTFYAIGVTILLLAAIFASGPVGRILQWFLSWKIWVPVAHLSYSVYLFHVFVVGWVLFNIKANLNALQLTIDAVGFYGWLLVIPVCFLLSILVAGFFYLLIEKPFMNMRK